MLVIVHATFRSSMYTWDPSISAGNILTIVVILLIWGGTLLNAYLWRVRLSQDVEVVRRELTGHLDDEQRWRREVTERIEGMERKLGERQG